MQKLCIRLLAKNARKRKAERQENQFIELFYYESFVKRTFKALLEHKNTSLHNKQLIKAAGQRRDAAMKFRVLRELNAITAKLRLLRSLHERFEKEVVEKSTVKEMFEGWKEAIQNKNVAGVFER